MEEGVMRALRDIPRGATLRHEGRLHLETC